MSSQLAAVGSSKSNGDYMSNRLGYADSNSVETSLAGAVSVQDVVAIMLRALAAGVVAFVVLGVPAIIIGALSALGSSSSYGGSDFGGAVGGVAIAAGLVLPGIAALVSLLIPRKQLLSEWQVTLDGAAASSDSVFASIFSVLRDHGIPVSVEARRLRLTGGEQVNNYLVVTSGKYRGYIASFAYGDGLYIGWSLWTSRLPIAMLVRFLLEGAGGGTRSMRTMLASSQVRAMREAIHSAAREGMDVAVTGTQVSIAATFGGEIPIEDLSFASSASTVGPPRPTWASGAQSSSPAVPPKPPVPVAARPTTPPIPARPATPPVPPPPAPTFAAPVPPRPPVAGER